MLWFSAIVVSRSSGGFPCSVHSFVAAFCRRRLSMDRKRADQALGRFTWKGLKIRKASPLDSNACWWNQPDLMLVQMVPAWSGAQTAARSGAYSSHAYTALTHAVQSEGWHRWMQARRESFLDARRHRCTLPYMLVSHILLSCALPACMLPSHTHAALMHTAPTHTALTYTALTQVQQRFLWILPRSSALT